MEWYASLALGIGIVIFGTLFQIKHWSAIHRFGKDDELTEKQRDMLLAQHQRRQFTTWLVIVTGFLIPLTYYAIDPLNNPIMATTGLCLILLLVMVIAFMAVADVAANRTFRGDIDLKRAEVELKRRMLEEDLERHQASHEEMIREQGLQNGTQ